MAYRDERETLRRRVEELEGQLSDAEGEVERLRRGEGDGDAAAEFARRRRASRLRYVACGVAGGVALVLVAVLRLRGIPLLIVLAGAAFFALLWVRAPLRCPRCETRLRRAPRHCPACGVRLA